MRGWPVHRPTHAPTTALKTNNNSAPQNKKSKPLVPSSPEAARSPETNSLVPSAPEHVKESPPIVIPEFSGAAPAVTENIRNLPRKRAGAPPPPQLLSVRPNNAHHQPKLLVQPLLRRHAWLAGPPANTCSRNSHQNKPQKNPPSSFRNLRRKAGLLSHRSPGGILSHPLPWSSARSRTLLFSLAPRLPPKFAEFGRISGRSPPRTFPPVRISLASPRRM